MKHQVTRLRISHLRQQVSAGAAVFVLTTGLANGQVAVAVSEKDFLSEMPIVLSVSRLPQRLDETPGSVTVLDRDMIARSGARDVADLLRWVPGFQVSNSFEMDAPLISYHGAFNPFSVRIELLIDGRSAYSPYLLGSIGTGLENVAIEDIERIEVLRGSNSAAYGARAILGVINIVTRHTADTLGAQAKVTAGSNGIHDEQARIGWGGDGGTYRLSADRRADDGLAGSNNHNQLTRINFRSDFNPTERDELQVRLGALSMMVGKGEAGKTADALRDSRFEASHAQVDWQHSVDADEDLLVRLSHTQENSHDEFPYALSSFGIKDSLFISTSGRSSSDSLLAQHTVRHGDALRWVWGGEFRSERVTSLALFNRDQALVTDFSRLFGNLEWRIKPTLLLNAGAMLEHSSVTGDSLTPRIMFNWQVAPGQTVRAGMSTAQRPPSDYEQFANVRFQYQGHLLRVTTKGTGTVETESLKAREISYLGDFPQWRAGLDLRLFHEHLSDYISQRSSAVPRYFFNDQDFSIRGLEYQLKWQPWGGAQLFFNQTFTKIGSGIAYSLGDLAAPKWASSLVFFQKLPGEIDLSLMHLREGSSKFAGAGAYREEGLTRTDLRLSKGLRWGSRRGEVALVVQNLGSAYRDFDRRFFFERQAFVSLRFEN